MFGSSDTAPAGYITMTAGDIFAGATALLDDRKAKQKAWDEALPGVLTAWASTRRWWARLYHSVPKDSTKLVEWYNGFEWTHERPAVDGLNDRPGTPGSAVDWAARAKRLPADTKVFINVDEGSVLTTWIPVKGTP